MGTIAEIENAIKKLPRPQVEELAHWLDAYRAQGSETLSPEDWLKRATGAALPGVTTAGIMALTRGEE